MVLIVLIGIFPQPIFDRIRPAVKLVAEPFAASDQAKKNAENRGSVHLPQEVSPAEGNSLPDAPIHQVVSIPKGSR